MGLNHKEYIDMVNGGDHSLTLTPEEEATVLFLYDYGLQMITDAEKHHLNVILSKLKDSIHP